MVNDISALSKVPPRMVGAVVLATVLIVEFGIMYFLSSVVPDERATVLRATIDSLLLTAILSPVLWWTVVQPLRHLADLRRQLVREVFDSVEEDRKRIARELHDGVGQSLTLLVSGMRSLPDLTPDAQAAKCESLVQIGQRALQETRQLSQNLRPSLLDDLGLAAAIRHLAQEMQANHPVSVTAKVAPLETRRLRPEVETVLFRVAQEALHNVVRHARASEASVELHKTDSQVELIVRDNGVGFVTGRSFGGQGHWGLLGMQERLAQVGGSLSIESPPGKGAQVRAVVPHAEAERE